MNASAFKNVLQLTLWINTLLKKRRATSKKFVITLFTTMLINVKEDLLRFGTYPCLVLTKIIHKSIKRYNISLFNINILYNTLIYVKNVMYDSASQRLAPLLFLIDSYLVSQLTFRCSESGKENVN